MNYRFAVLAAIPMMFMSLPASAQDADPTIIVTGKYLAQWENAKADEQKALEKLEEAQKKLNEANGEILKQDKDRSKDSEQAKRAEERFRDLTVNMPVFASAKDAKKWAGKVDDAADDWDDAVGDRRDHQKNLRSAMKDQSKYQVRVEKAQSEIDKARAKMAKAERQSDTARGEDEK